MSADGARGFRRINRHGVLGVLAAAAVVLAVTEIARSPVLKSMVPEWPIESVGVRGELRQVSQAELEAVIASSLAMDFFAVDVAALRNAALALPWVRDASVRRVWPDRVEVHVVERRVAARWAEGGLLDVEGELFHPLGGRDLAHLPILFGPPGTHARVLREFRVLEPMLAVLGAQVRRAGVDARGSWQVRLDSGITVVMGTEARSQARRLQQVQAALETRMESVARVDLRYANGFAVRWRPGAGPQQLQPGSPEQGVSSDLAMRGRSGD